MKTAPMSIFLLTSLLLISAGGNAQESTTGRSNMLGIRISSQDAAINNAVTYKRFLNQSLAVEGLFTFGNPLGIGALLEKHTQFGTSGLTWFWGAGAYVGFGGDRQFGAQGAAGLDMVLTTLPLNLSVDWKPELNFVKQFSFEPAAVGFSVRFVF